MTLSPEMFELAGVNGEELSSKPYMIAVHAVAATIGHFNVRLESSKVGSPMPKNVLPHLSCVNHQVRLPKFHNQKKCLLDNMLRKESTLETALTPQSPKEWERCAKLTTELSLPHHEV